MKDKHARRRKGFESIGKIVKDTLAPFETRYQDGLVKLEKRWPQIAGKHISAHCQPFALKDKLLLVKTENSTWLHNLQFVKAELVAKINADMGEGTICDIHFKVKA